LKITFTARNGVVTKSDISLGKSKEEDQIANEKLTGRKLHEVEDWDTILGRPTLMKCYLPTHYLNDEQFQRHQRVAKEGNFKATAAKSKFSSTA
jgi:hypothetical protein